MRSQGAGVADETSLYTSLYSLGCSDTLVQNQNHLNPVFPSLQNALNNLTTEQGIAQDVPLHDAPPVSYPFECTTPDMSSSTIERAIYSYGSMPFDTSFFNKFIASENVGLEHTSSSCNSYKPLHISQLLSGSCFLQAMQEILAEIACFALENFDHVNDSATGIAKNRAPLPICSENVVMFQNISSQERDVEAKKKRLLVLLQVVDDQYSQCLDEIHTVISAFHAVTELDPNLHARFALPAISLMYKNLREKISSHILVMGSHHSHGEVQAKEDHCSLETSFIQKQWALQQLRKKDHQLWRPQRGLPERSVAVLRAWMFQNFLHPYPKDAEKHLLAMKSGLTRSQVSNWFINARVRLWKPMIEEMYAEMNRRKAQRNANDEEDNGSNRIPVRSNHARFMG